MAERDTQFRKDVLKAKAKYRKRRRVIILSLMTVALLVALVQTFFYTREKKSINAEIAEQNATIEQLDKENKVNEQVIDKLKDPYFITDLVRQEYGLSYEGEIIFNLPIRESFLQVAIKAITEGETQSNSGNNARIDDAKIPELAKKDEDNSNTNNRSRTDSTDNKEDDSVESDTDSNNSNTTNQRDNTR